MCLAVQIEHWLVSGSEFLIQFAKLLVEIQTSIIDNQDKIE